jgi:photosystem II stability/assembly factor-like uncharacterized protein
VAFLAFAARSATAQRLAQTDLRPPLLQSGPAIGRTSDGGKTWQLFRAKDAPTILQMTFTDADHGWAFAVTGPNNTNILLRTTDGGASWHPAQVP